MQIKAQNQANCVHLLLNNLQHYKTISVLNDSNTLLRSINGSSLEFCFIYVVWWLFETKAFYAGRKKAKIG